MVMVMHYIKTNYTQEKPDAIIHFTDPRYWIWLYQMENEIRQQMSNSFILFGMIYLIPM